MKTNAKFLFIFVFLSATDQILKNTFSFSACNPYIAWSIPIAQAIFWLVWIAIVAALIYMFFKIRLGQGYGGQAKNYWRRLFLIFILAGAMSNIIDRLRFGCVIDYIDLNFFPVFNLGDVYITIGIIALIIFNFQPCLPAGRFSIFKK